MSPRNTTRQQGAALVVGMIMLVLITLMLDTALNLGTTNFRAMTNMQFRSEAISAANQAIEQVISSPFTAAPATDTIEVDIDNDADTDYTVTVAEPQCVFAAQEFSALPSSLGLPPTMTVSTTWNTVWDLDASVVPGVGAGNVGETRVRVRSGVRVLLSDAEKAVVCP
jgi:hypothetical protein